MLNIGDWGRKSLALTITMAMIINDCHIYHLGSMVRSTLDIFIHPSWKQQFTVKYVSGVVQKTI